MICLEASSFMGPDPSMGIEVLNDLSKKFSRAIIFVDEADKIFGGNAMDPDEGALMAVSTFLTSFNDNAAITYLAAQVPALAVPGPEAEALRQTMHRQTFHSVRIRLRKTMLLGRQSVHSMLQISIAPISRLHWSQAVALRTIVHSRFLRRMSYVRLYHLTLRRNQVIRFA
jgi:SpoVK/Ycf46/Vps4 family AAA+-type ATPase